MYEIYRECTFAASHQLRNYKGKCERLHGHNWRVGIHIVGDALDEAGMLMDFRELDAVLKEALESFDHRHLNEVPPFIDESPSSERLAAELFTRVSARLPSHRNVRVRCCDVWENDLSRARYYPGSL